ncbi:MAG: TAXI family TRAP transporter solute-binding subunit, partial [Vicinamibacterales bacterium]
SCAGNAGTSRAPRASLRLSQTTANDLQTALARIPDVKSEIVTEGGSSITSLLDLKNGKTNVSGTLADVAYLAYAGQLEEMTEPFDQLRGMAVTGLNTMHLLVGRDVRVKTLRDLKGLRVSLGAPGSSTAHITLRMLQDLGIAQGEIHAERVPNAEIVSRLSSGDIDAAFSGFSVPGAIVIAVLKGGARLIPIDGPEIEAMRTRYPYLKRTLIPRGTYPNQAEPVRTLGVDTLLVCRADVDDETVYKLLGAYFATRPAMTPPNLERAPATPIPLHPGAARYYRQRELSR